VVFENVKKARSKAMTEIIVKVCLYSLCLLIVVAAVKGIWEDLNK
jgi:hypothetical protein